MDLEEIVKVVVPPTASILELMGIFVIGWTGLRCFWEFLMNAFRHREHPVQYNLASGMATALAFKMAAEILKTVLVHDLQNLLLLGAIVLLRAIMSFLLHFELKHSKEDMEAAHELEAAVDQHAHSQVHSANVN